MRPKMTLQKNWRALSPGDFIDLIAPGMAFDREQLKAAQALLHSWNLEVRVPRKILGSHPVSANSRKARIDFFKAAVQSESKVIWAARGGYGSLHLVSELKKIKPPKQAKLLIGFSDICTLHHFVYQEWGWPVLHGPHIDRLAQLNSTRLAELRGILFGKVEEISFKQLKPMNAAALKTKRIQAVVTGGNMVTTQSTLGTPWQIQSAGKILFFEDIGERGYRVDRILEHLRLLGIFDRAKAVIFGPFTGGKEPSGQDKVPRVLKEFAAASKLPVYRGLASGHIPNSLSLPMNTKAVIQSEGGRTVMTVSTGCDS